MRSIRHLIAAWLVTPVLGATASAEPPAPPPSQPVFDVVVLGDLSIRQPEDADRALDATRALDPDFVLTTGNLVAPAETPDRWRSAWDAASVALTGAARSWYACAGENEQSPSAAGAYRAAGWDGWYTFEHRFCAVFVLGTREDPGSPGLSRTQIEWLGDSLASTDAEHLLVVMHDALWHTDHAGAWGPVHAMLVADGRPATVIAGNPAVYRDDGARDTVRYYTLGPARAQGVSTERLAFTWPHATLLRVRPDAVTPAVIKLRPDRDSSGILPGDWQTGAEIDAVERVIEGEWATLVGGVLASPDAGLVGDVVVTLTNPWTDAVRCTLDASSGAGASYSPRRWSGTLEPGASVDIPVTVLGGETTLERPRERLRATLDLVMSNGQRQRAPNELDLPVVLDLPTETPAGGASAQPGALALDGKAALEFDAPVGASYTLEAWVRADRARAGATIIVVGEGGPTLAWGETSQGDPAIRGVLPGADPETEPTILETQEAWGWDRWAHVALCVDGSSARIFVNGRMLAEGDAPTSDARGVETITIGASSRGPLGHGSWFTGVLDDVRVSRVSRYATRFDPPARLAPDADTLALFAFERPGPFAGEDTSGSARHAWSIGSPEVVTRSAE